MKTAAERLAALDALAAPELCGLASRTLDALVSILNQETTLLRAGRMRDASALTADKTQLAQDYMTYARSVQRQLPRLRAEAPQAVDDLHRMHDRLATQMAENLRVIATARAVTEDLLTDVAAAMNANARPRTYGAGGLLAQQATLGAGSQGLSINRAS